MVAGPAGPLPLAGPQPASRLRLRNTLARYPHRRHPRRMGGLGIGFGLGFLVALQVGPMSLLLIRSTLRTGLRVGLAIGAGIAVVDALYAAAGAASAASLVQLEPVRLVPGLLGAAVLLVLGARTLRSAVHVRAGLEGPAELQTPRRAFLTALGPRRRTRARSRPGPRSSPPPPSRPRRAPSRWWPASRSAARRGSRCWRSRSRPYADGCRSRAFGWPMPSRASACSASAPSSATAPWPPPRADAAGPPRRRRRPPRAPPPAGRARWAASSAS